MKTKLWRKILTLTISAAMLTAVFAGCGGDPTGTASTPAAYSGSSDSAPAADGSESEAPAGDAQVDTFPRNETLYYNGLQWGTPSNWNPFNSDPATFITINAPVPRELIYETLFMYNQLDGKLYGLLATEYAWNDQNLTIKLNPDAKWNDGTAFTSADVVYTYELAQKYALWTSAIWSYIDSVTAVDEHTVEIKGKAEGFNPKEIELSISSHYMVPKHIWEGLEAENGNDGAKLTQLVNDNPVSSGPYKVYSYDDTKMAIVRDDNYWGQAESMWGKLPAPKYIVHNIFKDNASGDAAFREGQVDVGQQFTSQIWKMWENDGLPIETYLPEAPYYIPGSIPSIVFNTTKPGLDDPAVRKAIAMSLDYDMIGQNAMSGYTAPMVPSLMLPTAPEQALIDTEALKPLQWSNADIEAANALLDEAGWVAGADGVREKDGVKLTFQVECPSGWTDWMASLEVVAQSSKAIGMDIQTYYPEMTVWINDRDTGNFDIIMHGYPGVGISSPWARARQTMSSKDVPAVGENAFWNYGRYSNARADELVDLLAAEADPAKMKEYWTELNEIYLTEVPAAGLMYRPLLFHQVNTSVWSGFPKVDDGSNIPPCICSDGYGIAALYNITAG